MLDSNREYAVRTVFGPRLSALVCFKEVYLAEMFNPFVFAFRNLTTSPQSRDSAWIHIGGMSIMSGGLKSALLSVSLLSSTALAAGEQDRTLEHANELLSRTILIDGHNDLPWKIRTDKQARGALEKYDLLGTAPGQTDFRRLSQGKVGGQFWSVYIPGEAPGGFAVAQLEQIDLARRLIARYPERLRLSSTAADIRASYRDGRIASILGMEGGYGIENSLGALRAYYDLGVRYMTLAHNTHTDWADSAAQVPLKYGGLSPFGEAVVREMNRIGMLVDLAHVAPETMDDVLRISRAPVIFSHSASKAICPVARNVPDDILRRLKDNGGVVMVTFVAGFIDPEIAKVTGPAMAMYNARARKLKTDAERAELRKTVFGDLKIPRTTIARVADHFDHIRHVAGVEVLGLGGDYDGNSDWPQGLEDVSSYPKLFAELIRRGWSDRELEMVAGGNVLRALERVEKVSSQLRAATPAASVNCSPVDLRSCQPTP